LALKPSSGGLIVALEKRVDPRSSTTRHRFR
jgi:hypothetical protein